MKFCVFGFDKNFPKVAKAKNNLIDNPFSYENAIICFKHAVESGKYREVYFLVDFGYAYAPFWKVIDVNYFGEYVIPWILISKWKAADDDTGEFSNQMIGKISLKMKGFSEKYDDCKLAMEKFAHYVDLKIKCELYADIFGEEHKFITSSQIVINKNKTHDNIYCKKYRI